MIVFGFSTISITSTTRSRFLTQVMTPGFQTWQRYYESNGGGWFSALRYRPWAHSGGSVTFGEGGGFEN